MLSFLFTKTPLLFLTQSFWRDESFSYLLAKKNIPNMLVLTAKDFNPPFYYLLLHFWMKIFGTSEIALRSLSLIFFCGTVYVIYLFLKEVFKFSDKKAFLYLLFIILNPVFLFYAFEARMYSMLAFFATLSFYSFYKKRPILYTLSSILGLYTHYFMLFVIAAQFIFSFLYRDFKKLSNKSVISFIFFLPWLLFFYLQKGIPKDSFWIEKTTANSFYNLLGIVYTGYENGFKLYEKLLLPLSLIFLGLILLKFKKNKTYIYLFFWGVVIPFIIVIISLYKPIFLPRYLIFSTVGLILLLIYVLENMPLIIKVFLLILISIFAINFQRWQLVERSKADVGHTISEIKKLAGPNDVLYVTSELEFFDAQYYFDENRVFIYGKTYQEIPNFVGKVLISKDKIVTKLPVYPKKAFILTSTDHYEIQAAF